LVRGILLGKLFRERSMEGVMATSVERTTIGARPLVRVYTRKRMSDALRDAGFSDIETSVRHFAASDTTPTLFASKVFPPLRDPRVLDRLGRVAGWYVIASGTRPR
jgi:hypothetical protein